MNQTKKQIKKTVQIKTLLLNKKKKQSDLVKKFKVSKSLISQAISGKPDSMPILQEKIFNYLKSL